MNVRTGCLECPRALVELGKNWLSCHEADDMTYTDVLVTYTGKQAKSKKRKYNADN